MQLKQKTFSAGRWALVSAVFRAVLQFAQIAVLARLLEPSQFGLMAVILAILAVVSLLADFGVTRIVIQQQSLTTDELAGLFWFNLLVSVGLALVLAALSSVIAAVYAEPDVAGVLVFSSLVLPLTALGMQFRALAEKELRFAALARNEMISAFIGFVVAIVLAVHGAGVYALVGAMLTTAGVSTLLAWLWLSENRRPGWRVRMHGVRRHLGAGGYLAGESLAGTLHREADIFVGGLLAGPAAMGLYAVPRDLCFRLANIVVNPVITRIGFPVMAKVQDDPGLLRRTYLATLRMTSSVNFPVYVLVGLFAEEIVAVLYGPRWHEATAFLQILAVWGLIRSVGNPVGSLIFALGRARLAFVWNLGLLVLTPVVLWLGMRTGGLDGLVWTMVVIQVVIFVPIWRLLVFPLCGAGFGEYVMQLLPPLLLALISGAVAVGVGSLIDDPLLRLLAGLGSAIPTYLLLAYRYNRPWLDVLSGVLSWPRRVK